MKLLNKLRHSLRLCAVVLAAAVMSLTACQNVDDTVGANLIPDNQQMRAGYLELPTRKTGDKVPSPRKYIETRLYQTDSIVSSNISSGYMGVMYNDTLGSRKAGFLSQYISYYRIDSGYFGYRPIFDSAQLKIMINSFGKDTTSVQEFEIYEITTNDYLKQKPLAAGATKRDTTFYINFDPEKVDYIGGRSIIGEEPIFTFTLGGENGPVKEAVTLKPTPAGLAFVKRLMLQEGKHKGDYSIYTNEKLEEFVEEFKGVYIKPKSDPMAIGSGSTRGTIYGTALKSSGISIFGRNRQKDDPTLIKDTIGLSLNFIDSYQDKVGGVSINAIDHDYSTATATEAQIDLEKAREPKPGEKDERPEVTRIIVEGLGGIVTEYALGEEFFKAMEQEIEEVNKRAGQTFRALAFNQAVMQIYFPSGKYDWQNIDTPNAGGLIAQMNAAPERLGMYTDYKQQVGIPDYDYVLEQQYSYSLAYDGYINRSSGCYTMNVTGYVQAAWNNYLDEKERSGVGRDTSFSDIDFEKIEWTKIKDRSVYLAPEAYDLFTSSFTILQGQAVSTDGSITTDAPIRLKLAYNLIK